MAEIQITIKPCPCGNTGRLSHITSNPLWENRNYAKPKHKIRCDKCGRETGWHDQLYDAVVEWNNREDGDGDG